ncbi:hypothetical protein EGI11_07110 [Chryseobacterium sp. H3056]|uniref:Uncharacterized protein n=1 Tax=Kaistella daneshvariae TaxID=2487074 RepID=A0A3N0WVT0_9FLAO|nr:hypothetical protein EGI11_07110 [Kaistella daneshvariae]
MKTLAPASHANFFLFKKFTVLAANFLSSGNVLTTLKILALASLAPLFNLQKFAVLAANFLSRKMFLQL